MEKRQTKTSCRGKQGGYHEGQKGWSDEETMLLIRLYASNGGEWKAISGHFAGRSSNSIHNRFYRIQKNIEKNQLEQETGKKCSKCGLRRRGHFCSLGVNLGEDAFLDTVFFSDATFEDYSHDESTLLEGPIRFAWPEEDSASLNC